MREKLKLITAVFFMTALTFVTLEVFLRIFDPLGVSYFSEVVRYFDMLEDRENYSYIHPAFMNETFQGVNIKTNSHGLRSPEFSAVKAEGSRRILILGDSVVLGWGVEYEDTFPDLLHGMYGPDENIEIIPAGVSSWNTRTEYEYFSRTAIEFEPDVLILIVVGNDTDPKDNSNIEVGKEELSDLVYRPNTDQDVLRKTWFFLVDRSYFFKHLQFIVKVFTEKDQAEGASKSDLTWLDTEIALDKMAALCESSGIEFIPFLFTGKNSLKDHPILIMYSEYFEENGIDCHTFPDILFKGYKYQNSVIDNHPNPEGHKIMAETLFSILNR